MIKIKEHLSDEEREQVLRRSNLHAWWQVLSTWSEIALLLALVSAFPNPLTLALVWLVLPGRQLALSVLMHEAGHNTLFTDRRLNQWVGQWLCALPTLNDLNAYATGHLDHHRLAGIHAAYRCPQKLPSHLQPEICSMQPSCQSPLLPL